MTKICLTLGLQGGIGGNFKYLSRLCAIIQIGHTSVPIKHQFLVIRLTLVKEIFSHFGSLLLGITIHVLLMFEPTWTKSVIIVIHGANNVILHLRRKCPNININYYAHCFQIINFLLHFFATIHINYCIFFDFLNCFLQIHRAALLSHVLQLCYFTINNDLLKYSRAPRAYVPR